MTEERLSRANELSNFVNAYKEVIGRYCNGMSVNENRLGVCSNRYKQVCAKRICRHKECYKKGFK